MAWRPLGTGCRARPLWMQTARRILQGCFFGPLSPPPSLKRGRSELSVDYYKPSRQTQKPVGAYDSGGHLMSLSEDLKNLKRIFRTESSAGLQVQMDSLRLTVEKGKEMIRFLRAKLHAVKEELRPTKQEIANEKGRTQVVASTLADERGANATMMR